MSNQSVKYSMVVPVFNEEESLEILLKEIETVFSKIDGNYEVVFVNDGSTDTSLKIMKQQDQKNPGIIQIVNLSRRSGQTFALKKGLRAALGDVLVTLDADLQNDPADIPKLIAKMEEGFDVVCGWRKNREDPFLKKILSQFGNIMQRLISGMRIHDVSCTLRAYKRECAGQLTLDWEGQHRFIPLILSRKGFKITEIISHHRERQFNVSKYGHKRIFKVMGDFLKILLTVR